MAAMAVSVAVNEMPNSATLRRLVYWVCVVFAASRACAEDRFAGLDRYILDAMEKWQVPGLAIAVVENGELVLARGYGVRQIGRDVPVSYVRRVGRDH
jgi:CubicO group peptidase (beta-lactamase class C family)